MLDEVTAALAAIDTEGTFATELTGRSDDLYLEVEGVGPIRFPISAATARRLCAVGRAAPFGRRDQTLHDPSVRDAWEIETSRLGIDAEAWRPALGAKLAIIRERLGLPEGGKLEAIPDKLLVYGPGQFFATHQDSERADDMVGSLVVELPSKHEGGDLVILHRNEKKVFPGAARGSKELSFVAFYSDCRHEVKPVRSGYRITLTYQLLYRGTAKDRAPVPLSAVDRLAASVKAYFSTPVVEKYSTAAPQRPDRLIYLLDHEYTQQSLGWGRLKNTDRLRVDALRQVAERLDWEAHLALADVHEVWSCEDGEWDSGYGQYGSDSDEDSEEEPNNEDYELTDLIDSDVELRHWVGPNGQAAPGIAAMPAQSEVCFTRPSTEMDPFKSEHEGYMGNYGNTVDRWYHRAALVMWPRARNFVVRAKVSPSWAVSELASRLEKGATDEARTRAKELLPFWSYTARQESSAAFVLELFTVSASLDDAALALELISPLGPHLLGPDNLPAFIALVERYGLAWSQRVFQVWVSDRRYDAPPWLSRLPRLCEALVAGGKAGEDLAPWLLSREVASFEKNHEGILALPEAYREESASRELDDLLALLEAAAIIGRPEIRDGLIAFLTAPKTALPLPTAGVLLQKCLETRAPAATRALGLQALYLHVEGSLERALDAKPRSAGDWSIEPPSGCACALCKQLSVFLLDRSRVQYAWPLAKERRQHIHRVIDGNRLPVTHTTIRRGSPQTLMLTKQEALFARDAELRARQKALLIWLEEHRSAFCERSAE